MKMPTYDEMMNPLLKALHELGGSGNIDEINSKVIEIMDLPDKIIENPHDDSGTRSELEYRLAWTRTYLKKYGLLENSTRGIWALTETKDEPIEVNRHEVVKIVRAKHKQNKKKVEKTKPEETEVTDDTDDWKEQLSSILLSLTPTQFERLTQRILRESGFTQVEVTVSASQIRDFRGALQGRADKGLLITTGSFTRDAIKEAQRDGAPPIDLIDGNDLADKLKELSLGISVEMFEKVIINNKWFEKI
jgi:restriction system protein